MPSSIWVPEWQLRIRALLLKTSGNILDKSLHRKICMSHSYGEDVMMTDVNKLCLKGLKVMWPFLTEQNSVPWEAQECMSQKEAERRYSLQQPVLNKTVVKINYLRTQLKTREFQRIYIFFIAKHLPDWTDKHPKAEPPRTPVFTKLVTFSKAYCSLGPTLVFKCTF